MNSKMVDNAPVKLLATPKVAIVASKGLGDGLIFLVIANNLQKNGFKVTFYSNFISHLQSWIPAISVKPFPNKSDLKGFASQYDLVLSDAASVITDASSKEKYTEIAKDYVFICMSRFSKDLIFDHSKLLTEKIKDNKKLKKLLPLAKASGTLISNLDKECSMVERVAKFCKDILDLENVTIDNGLRPPDNLVYQKHKSRIVVHPESSNVAKNWYAKKFVRLARLLKCEGWDPVFIVSPAERKEWKTKIGNEFLLPEFSKISDLASFIYESGFMIGNDSGIAHLASNLKIPTLIIIKSTKKNYRWRPGWHAGEIVNAPFQLKFRGKHYWQYLVSVKKVFSAFNEFVERINEEKR
jgi:heptosyltransferase III